MSENNSQSIGSIFKNGIIAENPVFFQLVGMCPTLAVTSSGINGFGMGVATTAVLIMSNFFISLIRKIIPDEVRIPSFIVVIATFVTIIGFLLKAFLPELDQSLGLFIPLIVVNCLILARAEAFASKNSPIISAVDGLAMGLGFTFALTVIGLIREFFGASTLFGITVLPEAIPQTLIMILPPGAFFTLGAILAGLKAYSLRKGGKK
ncbi:MAG: electron transport complex subunit RsxE [Lachnospirales bacterium]